MYREGPTRRRARSATTGSPLESLEARTYFAVHAFFVAGRLSVFGDSAANSIVIGRNPAGTLLVNGGTVGIRGGPPTGAAARQILVYGLSGNDEIRLDETNGALPKATLDGGPGNDTITGGSGADILVGRAGNDFLFGQGEADLLTGGDGNDALTGGAGDDMAFGQAGDDNLFWAPGDGSDRNEGGDGTDTVVVNGATASEHFTAAPNGERVRFERTDPTPFSLDIGTVENLSLRANSGDDSFTAVKGLGSLIHLTVDGGVGNDTILGSDGADELAGRDGNDVIDGGPGDDDVFLGAGDDTFVWNLGGGNDVVEGQDGADKLVFNAPDDGGETTTIAADGPRVRFVLVTDLVRFAPADDLDNVALDLNGLERIDFNTFGGANRVNVGDLSGTGLVEVNVDLRGSTGAGSDDSVLVNGTAGADSVSVRNSGNVVAVVGLPAFVKVTGAEPANDQLVIDALGGDDVVNASTLQAGVIRPTFDGGAGNDSLVGSHGADTLLGGDGDDFVEPFTGNDVADLGAGSDTFEWDPGDGSDVVDGGTGSDTMTFNGADLAENVDVSANGRRVRFARDLGNVVMDLGGVEQIDFNAFGGADTVTVSDPFVTDLDTLNLDLSSASGLGDGAGDSIVLNGTAGGDTLQVASVNGGSRIAVGGLFPFVNIIGAEGASDRLTVNTLDGDDVVDAGSLPAFSIGLTLNGGAGNDTLVGGAGDDTFVWNPGEGNDSVEGLGGRDAMIFNGADLAEIFGISANGNRVRLSRDVDNVTLDVNDVERLGLTTSNGADKIVVNDLTGTDVEEIDLNLAAAGGGAAGDGNVDSVIVNGGAAGELIPVTGTAGGILVNGAFAQNAALQYFMVIRAVEPADMLQINGNGGNDSIDASALQTPVTFRAEGGAGNDIIRGSPGDDVLVGGDGDDGVDGNGGSDSAFLGNGDDTFVWDPGDGSDLVEGMAGADNLAFRGSNGGEQIDLSADGDRLRLVRNVGPVTMDVDDVERVTVVTLGGPDRVVVNDLSATDVIAVDVNLGAGGTANGDLLTDSVVVNGTAGADRFTVSNVGGAPTVSRLTTAVRVTGFDPAFDSLTVDGLAGDDTIDASALPDSIPLALVGGDGNDTLTGGAGDDFLSGGAGNDLLKGGPGADILDGGAGTNVLIQD